MPDLSAAIGKLREALVNLGRGDLKEEIIVPREGVLARFGPLFQPGRIASITEAEFRPFLYFDQNHHWTGLHRQVNRLCRDMPLLQSTLSALVQESRPIDERFNFCGDRIVGLGSGIMTAVLTVAFPAKYGVWNGTSEDGLLDLGIWPEFGRGTSTGAKYVKINQTLESLKNALGVDFWTLDAIWYQISLDKSPSVSPSKFGKPVSPIAKKGASFGLERHLHDFLDDNWDQIELGKDWAIYSEEGAPKAGYEYQCGVGRIDILARHRTLPRWLIIELKRDDTADSTAGQALRYMGWVRQHLATASEEVHGLIIARGCDDKLQYAVSAVPNLKLMTYSVEFSLRDTDFSTPSKL